MKLWTSGEVQADIGEAYRELMNLLEKRINLLLEKIEIPEPVVEWAFIAIIRAEDSPDYGEVAKYWRRDKSLEFRLKISHAAFLAGTLKDRVGLVLAALDRSVGMMSELKVGKETQAKLQSVLKHVAEEPVP